ncbi:unnamed protein product [Candidula unifasciata]|uniref:Transmembrane protein 115 n=1 Tax=Candidula unifasciata TaxID=100452 RepID=A0A8S3YXN4_9EUPU|nr:unnamed protein product [Candidula unifasciata]
MAASIAHSRFPTFKENLSAAFGKSSIVVKTITIAVILGYLCSFISSAVPFITITPGYVLPPNFHVYSLIPFCFVELHIWHVVVDAVIIILFGKLLEPLWGAREMLLFFIVVNMGVGILTAFVYLFIYLVTLKEEYLFDVHIHGLSGYIAGFCVALKQVMPDHCLAVLPFGKLKNTHVPLALLALTIGLRVAGLLPGAYPYMFANGLLVSWVYLRFYQKHSDGNRGDLADNFSFASFFPSQLQPLIAVFANTIFSGLVKLKLCKKPQRRYDVSSSTTITVTLPGTEPRDAERRKQLAIKALNERLSKVDSAPNWPTLDDDDEDNEKPASSVSASSSFTSQQSTAAVGSSAATPLASNVTDTTSTENV